jgi:hypothetical protein
METAGKTQPAKLFRGRLVHGAEVLRCNGHMAVDKVDRWARHMHWPVVSEQHQLALLPLAVVIV